MKTAHAHDLVGVEPGTEVVISTHLRTYVGWLIQARGARGWVTLQMEDFRNRNLVDTIRVPDEHVVHYTPFPPLEIGSIVVRRSWDDPNSERYREAVTGRVDVISRTRDSGLRVYKIQFSDSPAPRWYSRRTLLLVDADILAELVEEVAHDVPAPRLD
jgi:hypothetical protein